MKKVSVIGATGFVGTQVINELKNRGYHVNAIARNTENVAQNEQVTAQAININDEAALAEAVKGSDAVISTFNAGWTNPNLYNDFLNGSRHIERAVEAAGVKRLIVVGGAGSLYTENGEQLVDSPSFPADIKPGATAARDYLQEIKNNNSLDWTYFSPAIEMHAGTAGVRKGTYRTGTDNPVFDKNGSSILSVEDAAVALVDELEKNQFIKQRFTAAY